MINISMFPHNGSGNHGCEAIVRSTYELIKECGNPLLFSERLEEDQMYMHDVPLKKLSAKREITRLSSQYFKALYRKHVTGDSDAFNRITFDPFIDACKNGVFLSIGGDLYCYETPTYLYKVHRYVKEVGAKSVLWGCSVDPKDIDAQMAEDLASYDLICARESISYEGLKKVNRNTILTVDPAFNLPTKKVALPDVRYVGVNVSPMIADRESIRGITMVNYVNLIRHILSSTPYSIALIPHVVWSVTDDRTKLLELKNKFSNDSRVVLVDDMNCMELKYVISKSEVFIGARTHATIAAYSSCVPTLVVGYSVKSKGIAKDIFGTYQNYVIPVQTLEKDTDLVDAFDWIYERKDNIRIHLQDMMPMYKEKTQTAVNALKGLL